VLQGLGTLNTGAGSPLPVSDSAWLVARPELNFTSIYFKVISADSIVRTLDCAYPDIIASTRRLSSPANLPVRIEQLRLHQHAYHLNRLRHHGSAAWNPCYSKRGTAVSRLLLHTILKHVRTDTIAKKCPLNPSFVTVGCGRNRRYCEHDARCQGIFGHPWTTWESD